MKKVIGFILIVLVSLVIGTPTVFSAADDVVTSEVRQDVTVWKMENVEFEVFKLQCVVEYRKGYLDAGDFVPIIGRNGRKRIVFVNTPDDPSTTEVDETVTEFSQLLNLINNESNIKNSITKAVKIKLGL